MQKNILIYGVVSGAIVSAIMVFGMNYLSHCNGNVDYGSSMLIGYASMLLAFSLVFVGVRNYRDKYNGGVISFGKAFKMAMLMVLIASTMYVVTWQIDYFFFIPDFMDKLSAHELEQMKASGASQAVLEAKTREMADMAIKYKNPFYNVLFTYAEILPVGIIVALISSVILKRRTPADTQTI